MLKAVGYRLRRSEADGVAKTRLIYNELDLMPGLHDPTQNLLLAALSPPERERIFPHLQRVPMALGRVLYESGDVLRHVYFPTDSIISLLYVTADGASAEISVVGNEGLIGVALFMGGETPQYLRLVVLVGCRPMSAIVRRSDLLC